MLRRALTFVLALQLLNPGSQAWAAADGSTLAIGRGLSASSSAPADAPSSDLFSGAATYSIPIEVAVGTGGVQPNLVLTYSSHDAHSASWVGTGWNLNLGSVTRSLREGVPAYDNAQDQFSLNGRELVYQSGEWHTLRETYLDIRFSTTWEVRSKNGTVSRYGARGGATESNCIINNPTPGLAAPKFSWLLCEQEDLHGNQMQVFYDRSDPGMAYIQRIDYGTSGSLNRSVHFILEDRPDDTLHYTPGFEQQMNKRLAAIEVRANGELIRAYELFYGTPSSDTGRSLLREVKLYGSDYGAGTPVSPHVQYFDYHSNVLAATEGWVEDLSWTWPANVYFVLDNDQNTDGGTRIADLDGDGLPDLLREMRVGTSSETDADSGFYPNQGNAFGARSDDFRLPIDPAGNRHYFARRSSPTEESASGFTVLADLTRDGRADMVAMFGRSLVTDQDSGYYTYIHRAHNTSAGWNTTYSDWGTLTLQTTLPALEFKAYNFSWEYGWHSGYAGGGTSGVTNGRTELSDLNGDGYLDFTVRHLTGALVNPGEQSFVVNQGTIGTGFGAIETDRYQICSEGTSECGLKRNSTRHHIGLYPVYTQYGTLWVPVIDSTRSQGKRHLDINADGLDDYIFAYQHWESGGTTDWHHVWLNDGTDYVQDDRWVLPVVVDSDSDNLNYHGVPSFTEDEGVRFADINGDGLVDMVKARENQTKRVWLSTGDPGAPWQELASNSPWQMPAGIEFSDEDRGRDLGVRFADFDGDGMVDLAKAEEGQAIKLYRNAGSPPDLLVGVTNRFGGTTDIEYTPSTQFDHTDPTSGEHRLPQVMQLVTKTTTDDLRGNVAVTEYDYQGGLYDAPKREFRGFREVVATVRQGDAGPTLRETLTHFHQDEPRVGLVEWSEVGDGQSLWARTQNLYTGDLDGPGPPYAHLLKRTDRLEYDGLNPALDPPRRIRTEHAYESNYGNLLHTIEYGEVSAADVYSAASDLKLHDTSITENFYTPPNTIDHIVGKISHQTIRQGETPGSGTLLRQVWNHYDGAYGQMPTLGELTKRVEDDGDSQTLDPETSYGYDSYGNQVWVRNARENAGEIPTGTGTTTTVFDSTFHTFPIAVLNGLNHQTSLDYAPYGQCASHAALHPDLHIDPNYPAGAGLVAFEQSPNDLLESGSSGIHRCYDVFGRMIVERREGHTHTGWVYDDTPGATNHHQWQLANAATSTGILTRTDFNGQGSPWLVRTDGPQSAHVYVETQYDALGRVIRESDPYFSGQTPRYTETDYDPLGRTIETRLPGSGRVYSVSYDHDGIGSPTSYRVEVTTTDPNGNAITRVMDPWGRVVEVEEWNGPYASGSAYRTHYTFDAVGQLVEVEDHHENVTSVGWDLLGRKKSMDDPDSGLTTFEYDASGNLKKQAGPLGFSEWTYDALDRPLTYKLQNWLVPSVEWQYDKSSIKGIGLPHKRIDRLSGVTYTAMQYDILGRVTHERYRANKANHDFHTSYDPIGQVLTRSYPRQSSPQASPDPRIVEWLRDDQGYLTDIVSEGTSYVGGAAWHPDGQIAGYWSHAAFLLSYVRDPATGRLSDINIQEPIGFVADHLFYGYDAGDRVTSIGSDWGTQTYGYDGLDRLEWATGQWGTHYFHYDPIGNLTCRASTSATVCEGSDHVALGYQAPQSAPGVRISDPSFSAGAHAAVTVNGAPVTYDASGNVTGMGTRGYAYDLRGKLTSASEAGSVVRKFSYDVDGQLARVSTPPGYSGDPVNRIFLTPDFEWDVNADLGRIHLELGGSTVVTIEDTYDPRRSACGIGFEVALLLLPLFGAWNWLRRLPRGRRMDGALAGFITLAFLLVSSLPLGPPLVRNATASPPVNVISYFGDHLGSTIGEQIGGATQLNRKIYHPYGKMLAGYADVSDFGFNNQLFEPELGIYDYGARWYDPDLGRFLQPDSIVPEPGDPQSLNRYSYVRNNPLNRIDPSGNLDFEIYLDMMERQAEAYAGVGEIIANFVAYEAEVLPEAAKHVAETFMDGTRRGGIDQGIAAVVVDGVVGIPGEVVDTYDRLNRARSGEASQEDAFDLVNTGFGMAFPASRALKRSTGRRNLSGADEPTLRRFVRQDEFDSFQDALNRGDDLELGRWFTPDDISDPRVATMQLALPGTNKNPVVGFIDVRRSALDTDFLSFGGPRISPPFTDKFGVRKAGGGLEVEFFRNQRVPASAIRRIMRTP